MVMNVFEDGGVQLKQLARTQDISQEWHTSSKLEAIVSLIISRRLSCSAAELRLVVIFAQQQTRGGELVDVGNAWQRRKPPSFS